jgi:YebC/PmpR family DNA-binding regulatory protein
MGRSFENRKHAMARRGDRDAKAFTRAGRQISMAVKAGGPSPEGNPALRRAIQNARAANMPKDKVQAAIVKASGAADADTFEEVLYEGYGPHGIAILVETATDNIIRTVANLRSVFKRGDGNLGTLGSVSFLFDRFGHFHVAKAGVDREALELELIDHGLEDLFEGEDEKGTPTLILRCARDQFGSLQAALEEQGIEVLSSSVDWVPKTTTALTEEQEEALVSLVHRLEDDDDVQKVFTNAEGF